MLRFVLRLIAATSLLLASVGVAPVSAGGGCHGEDGSVHSEGDATVVRMGPCSFSPTVVHVPAGTEVRFLNTAAGRPPGRRRVADLGHAVRAGPRQGARPDVRGEGRLSVQLPAPPGHGRCGRGRRGGRRGASRRRAAAGGDSQPVGNAAPAAPAAGATHGDPVGAQPRRPARRRPSCWSSGARIAAAAVIVALAWRRQCRRPHAVARGVIRLTPAGPRQARLTPGPVGPTASTVPTRHAPTPAASRSASTAARRSGSIAASSPPEVCGSCASATSSGGDPLADGERGCREPPVVRGAAGLDAGPGEVERARERREGARHRTRGAHRTRAPSRGRGPGARTP